MTVTAILMTAVLSSYAPPDCPPPNDGAVALFPCPEDCSKFWECDNGNPVLMHCPDGLCYNSELQVCDFVWNMKGKGTCYNTITVSPGHIVLYCGTCAYITDSAAAKNSTTGFCP